MCYSDHITINRLILYEFVKSIRSSGTHYDFNKMLICFQKDIMNSVCVTVVFLFQ